MDHSKVWELVAWWLGDGAALVGAPVRKAWQAKRGCYARHLAAAAGDVAIAAFAKSDFWHVQRYAIGRGLSTSTTNKITHNVFSAMLRDGEGAGFLSEGTRDRVMRRAADKLRDEGERDTKSLSLVDRDRVIESFRGHWSETLVSFLFYTGMRIGEVAGLRQRDVDWYRRTIRIQRSRYRGEVTPAKTRGSQRTIKLPRAGMALLASLRNDETPDDFLFRSRSGVPLHQDRFREKVWHPKMKELRLGGFQIHGCRHTFITLSLEAGISIGKVAAYVGASQRMIESTYSHIDPLDDWDRAIRAPVALRAVK